MATIAIRLLPITAADEDLAVRLECDPELMRHVGGPRPEADVRAAHQRRLDLMAKGDAQMYKIVTDDASAVLGTIGMWKIDWEGPQSYEMGWFVLPEHQGKGVATTAARLLLARARANPDVRYVHAYPAVTNDASNALARKIGMEKLGEFDNEGFAGILRCNNWRIGLLMQQSIIHIALVVREYDEAIEFFCGKLYFTLIEDTYQPEQDKRWVLVAPPGSPETTLLLARATNPEQLASVGNQTGGRVFLFLATDDFWRDYHAMVAAGIRFVREPKQADYGTVAVFEDLYGNLWDLVQPSSRIH